MSRLLDRVAHALLEVMGALVAVVLWLLDTIEGALKSLMGSAGVSRDVQTVILLLILISVLVGVVRMLAGAFRLVLAIVLLLVLVHVIAGVSHGPVVIP